VPKRAARCEAALTGARWNAATIEKAAQALAADYQPISDLRASREYRTNVAAGLLRRFHADVSGAAGDTSVWSYAG
jgi:xanthine dehydrogenase small subunit